MIHLKCKAYQTILKSCQENGVWIDGICGGNGSCQKCKVRVIEGVVPPSEKDISFFTKEELEEGYRLACHAVPQTDCIIELTETEDEMEIVSEGISLKTKEFPPINKCFSEDNDVIGNKKAVILIDIGTTTLVIQLCMIENGESKILSSYAAKNRQGSFGADVISRIQASIEGNKEELRNCIVEQLEEGIGHVIRTAGEGMTAWQEMQAGEGIRWSEDGQSGKSMKAQGAIWVQEDIQVQKEVRAQVNDIDCIVIAGNTTMIHLLMGYDCKTLGCAPFTPVTTDGILMHAETLFGTSDEKDEGQNIAAFKYPEIQNSRVYIFPGISTFVGGDIISGLYAVDFIASDKTQIFLDLGTNGEMAIGNKERILTASAAAGPAFEGGNITCGMASIKGAIGKAVLRADETWEFTTIQNGKPAGICGSGLIEIIYELYTNGKLDETGLLFNGEIDKLMLCEETRVYITQKDIRMFQMAKAAICAGIETLIKEYGITEDEIDKVWIAGGFSAYLDIKKATTLGLFPKKLQDKITCVGNTALSGLKRYVRNNQPEAELLQIKKQANEVSLANNTYFEERLIENMYL